MTFYCIAHDRSMIPTIMCWFCVLHCCKSYSLFLLLSSFHFVHALKSECNRCVLKSCSVVWLIYVHITIAGPTVQNGCLSSWLSWGCPDWWLVKFIEVNERCWPAEKPLNPGPCFLGFFSWATKREGITFVGQSYCAASFTNNIHSGIANRHNRMVSRAARGIVLAACVCMCVRFWLRMSARTHLAQHPKTWGKGR